MLPSALPRCVVELLSKALTEAFISLSRCSALQEQSGDLETVRCLSVLEDGLDGAVFFFFSFPVSLLPPPPLPPSFIEVKKLRQEPCSSYKPK